MCRMDQLSSDFQRQFAVPSAPKLLWLIHLSLGVQLK